MSARSDSRLRRMRQVGLGARAAACAIAATLALGACDANGRDARSMAAPGESRVAVTPAPDGGWGVGRAASTAEVAAWDLDVNPRGVGLPPGRGTHADGARTYAQKCASCHGARGEGIGSGSSAVPRLVGREPRDGFPFGRDLAHVKTVGNYWPYATTVYDYVRRAMPLDAPGSLTPDELYGLTAFLLAENEIIARDAVMDARSLPQVRMPAAGRFVPDDRAPGNGFR